MLEYGKTENIFTRDPDTHKLIPWAYKQPEVNLVAPHAWMYTEKIDGMNVRLIMSEQIRGAGDEIGYKIELRGRSDKANLPGDLKVEVPSQLVAQLFRTFEMPPWSVITLYGEAYGAGIQKGGMYAPNKRVRFFDMVTSVSKGGGNDGWDHSFRPWAHLDRAASVLGLATVPQVFFGNLMKAVEAVAEGLPSITADYDGGSGGPMEGVIGRTEPYIYDYRGNRVFFKVKTKDLQ